VLDLTQQYLVLFFDSPVKINRRITLDVIPAQRLDVGRKGRPCKTVHRRFQPLGAAITVTLQQLLPRAVPASKPRVAAEESAAPGQAAVVAFQQPAAIG
jgi:hypothetical protein